MRCLCATSHGLLCWLCRACPARSPICLSRHTVYLQVAHSGVGTRPQVVALLFLLERLRWNNTDASGELIPQLISTGELRMRGADRTGLLCLTTLLCDLWGSRGAYKFQVLAPVQACYGNHPPCSNSLPAQILALILVAMDSAVVPRLFHSEKPGLKPPLYFPKSSLVAVCMRGCRKPGVRVHTSVCQPAC